MSRPLLANELKNIQQGDTLHGPHQVDVNLQETFINTGDLPEQVTSYSWNQPAVSESFSLKYGQVVSNRLLPYKVNPFPSTEEIGSIYVVNVEGQLGFTAKRLSQKITPQDNLNRIRQVFNQQIVNDMWNAAVSYPILEEEILEYFGFFIVIRKVAVSELSDKQRAQIPEGTTEVWDTTVWDFNNGAFRAVTQFISTQEPEPALFKDKDGHEEIVYLLSDTYAIKPNMDERKFDVVDIQTSGGKIAKRIKK